MLILKGLYLLAIKQEMDSQKAQKLSKIAALTKIDVPEIPFLRTVSHEPVNNFHNYTTKHEDNRDSSDDEDGADYCVYEVSSAKPDDTKLINKIDKNEAEGSISCFLWQQSFFYNKARVDVNAWQLRWFTFTINGIVSTSSKSCGSHTIQYPQICKVEVDERHLLIKLHRTKGHKRPYIFLAPTMEILVEVVLACDLILKSVCETTKTTDAGTEHGFDRLDEKIDVNSDGRGDLIPETEPTIVDEYHHSMIAYPYDGDMWRKVLFYPLFPFNALVHFTVPDVRRCGDPGAASAPPLLRSFATIAFSVVWLVISSYVLVESLEELGRLMNIPHAIIGVTVSAAGTSVANLVASQCAARQGLGNMAVSNAFGSNSFIIFVGLGLPWFTFCVTEQDGEPYYKIRDEGMTESVIIMAVILVVFMLALYKNDWVLYKKHAKILIAGYALYVLFAVAQLYF